MVMMCSMIIGATLIPLLGQFLRTKKNPHKRVKEMGQLYIDETPFVTATVSAGLGAAGRGSLA